MTLAVERTEVLPFDRSQPEGNGGIQICEFGGYGYGLIIDADSADFIYEAIKKRSQWAALPQEEVFDRPIYDDQRDVTGYHVPLTHGGIVEKSLSRAIVDFTMKKDEKKARRAEALYGDLRTTAARLFKKLAPELIRSSRILDERVLTSIWRSPLAIKALSPLSETKQKR
jgi:hypothetical protein